MATKKPRTNVKRPTSSRSVRVTKKKQGVTRKQGLVAVAVLAIIGLVAVVASHAATAPRSIYIGTHTTNVSPQRHIMNKVASDGSSKSSYDIDPSSNFWLGWTLSRDKSKFSTIGWKDGKQVIGTVQAGTGAVGSKTATTADVSERMEWMPGDASVLYRNSSTAQKVYSISLDGSSSRKLLATEGDGIFGPLVQPGSGATKFLYNVNSSAIVTRNLDGTGRKVIVNASGTTTTLYNPSWSPSGKKIMYYVTGGAAGNTIDLAIVNADGTGKVLVDTNITDIQQPSTSLTGSGQQGRPTVWSPGSTSVLFTKKVNGIENLYYANISTKKITKVTSSTNASTVFGMYGWANDGRIVYAYGTKVAGQTPTPITTVKSVKADLTGAKILYTAKAGESIGMINF